MKVRLLMHLTNFSPSIALDCFIAILTSFTVQNNLKSKDS